MLRIDEKMSQLLTPDMAHTSARWWLTGISIYTDATDIKAFPKELFAIGRNINQIAKRINAGGSAYPNHLIFNAVSFADHRHYHLRAGRRRKQTAREDFIFWNVNRPQIKRKLFEKYIDQCQLV